MKRFGHDPPNPGGNQLFTGPKEVEHESIVNWLLPHLSEAKTG